MESRHRGHSHLREEVKRGELHIPQKKQLSSNKEYTQKTLTRMNYQSQRELEMEKVEYIFARIATDGQFSHSWTVKWVTLDRIKQERRQKKY